MKVGLLMVFQNFKDKVSDAEAYQRDMHIADLAEPLGFNTLGAVEHHFNSYAMARAPKTWGIEITHEF